MSGRPVVYVPSRRKKLLPLFSCRVSFRTVVEMNIIHDTILNINERRPGRLTSLSPKRHRTMTITFCAQSTITFCVPCSDDDDTGSRSDRYSTRVRRREREWFGSVSITVALPFSMRSLHAQRRVGLTSTAAAERSDTAKDSTLSLLDNNDGHGSAFRVSKYLSSRPKPT